MFVIICLVASAGAIETLAESDKGALSYFYIGRSHFALEDNLAAIENYDLAERFGYDRGICVLAKVEALRNSGDFDGALQGLESLDGGHHARSGLRLSIW